MRFPVFNLVPLLNILTAGALPMDGPCTGHQNSSVHTTERISVLYTPPQRIQRASHRDELVLSGGPPLCLLNESTICRNETSFHSQQASQYPIEIPSPKGNVYSPVPNLKPYSNSIKQWVPTPTPSLQLRRNPKRDEILSSTPAASATPTPRKELTVKEQWELSVVRGRGLWQLLQVAQKGLWEKPVIDMPHWDTAPPKSRSPDVRLCSPWDGLLYRTDALLCSRPLNWYESCFGTRNTENDKYLECLNAMLTTGMDVKQNMIISEDIALGRQERTDSRLDPPKISAEPLDTWPEISFEIWRQKCDQATKNTASLQTVIMSKLFGRGSDKGWAVDANWKTLQYIADHDPQLHVIKTYSRYYTSTLRYTPEDDNFFALLGTAHGNAVMELLMFHAKSFATMDQLTGAAEKVKSIRDIQIAGNEIYAWGRTVPMMYNAAPSGSPPRYIQRNMNFDMIITLQDVSPRVSNMLSSPSPSPSPSLGLGESIRPSSSMDLHTETRTGPSTTPTGARGLRKACCKGTAGTGWLGAFCFCGSDADDPPD